MKKQNSIYIAIVVILAASLACNVGGTTPATEVGQEPTDIAGQTSSAATTAPVQETGGVDGPPGPETIDLTNPALYIVPDAPAYQYESTLKITGVDTAGSPKEFLSFTSVEVQTLPQIAQHVFFEGDLIGAVPSDAEGSINIQSSDTVIIGDQMTSAQMVSVSGGTPELFCNTGSTASVQGPGLLESTLKSMPKIQTSLTGQAPRVESGVEVNGFVTDKYELTVENFVRNSGELSGAFVYVARSGGFITRVEQQGQDKIPFSGFDPNQIAEVSLTSNYILVEDGSLEIVVPAECNK